MLKDADLIDAYEFKTKVAAALKDKLSLQKLRHLSNVDDQTFNAAFSEVFKNGK